MRKSPEARAHLPSLRRRRPRAAQVERLDAKLARWKAKAERKEARAARAKRKTEILLAANRFTQAQAAKHAAKARRVRAAIDQRIGRYTIDVLVFLLLSAAWWFWFIDELLDAGWRDAP